MPKNPKFPDSFDYLVNFYPDDSMPKIIEDIRYAGSHNFMGRPIEGYNDTQCVVSNKVGFGLIKAQKVAITQGYTLKIYDAYRPLKASADMLKWSLDPEDQTTKGEFYLHVNKGDVFKLGYVALQSGHTRGAAVDVTLVKLDNNAQSEYRPGDTLKDASAPNQADRFPDNSIDMGTGWDCFHERSHTKSPLITEEQAANRLLLADIMMGAGFEGYQYEWWHFALTGVSKDIYYDFDIE